MTKKEIKYALIDIGFITDENINLDETHKNILNRFYKDLFKKIKNHFLKNGIELKRVLIYKPFSYNYEVDTLDFVINVINKEKLKKFILKNKDEINKRMQNNFSYDGYIALTRETFKQELQELVKKDYEPDFLVMYEMILPFIDEIKDLFYSCIVYDENQ